MPAFTTTPAALRRLSRTGSLRTGSLRATSPDSTNTPASTDGTAQPDAAALTAPASPTAPDSLVVKALRAYERDRQRALKTKARAEREREREERQQQQRTPTPDARPCRHCRDGSGRRPAAPVLTPGVEDIIADVVEREGRARGSDATTPYVELDRPLEVQLAQLVKPGKTRRSRAGEFELVPGIPVVIALDDRADEAELDEPWEHISADELDEKRIEPPSYATIVASTA